MTQFDFHDLFVLDMANNHQGSVEHGLRIVREHGEVVNRHNVRAALKFQFRQLDTFIHAAHKESSDNKHIGRFLSTRLEPADYQVLLDAVREVGMVSMCTPFDEESVDVIVDMGFDIIKIASCSAKDWPLIEKIAETGLPVIFSTGGLEISDIDNLVSFFEHRGVDFAIMHCVSQYPIPTDEFQLNQIDLLRRRYHNNVIGWSTHEDPKETAPVHVAVAKGARMFERHVGVVTDEITLNAYSSTPQEVDQWISAWSYATRLCGVTDGRPPVNPDEKESLNTLRRGVFAKKPLLAGKEITRDQVYFAMPYTEGQLDSGAWKEGVVAQAAVQKDGALMLADVDVPPEPEYQLIKNAIHDIKALLNEAGVPLNSDFDVEFSHHYGMEEFKEYGAVIIGCINRSYCKKIIVQLPGQNHPEHFHKRKEETFQVLFGTLNVKVDGHLRVLHPGQTLLVQPGVWHSFWTDDGCVFEEVSTTHYDNDSVYKDKKISGMSREERKSVVDHWGRFQIVPEDDAPVGVEE